LFVIPQLFCLSFRSEAEESAFVFAFAVAFLVVIPEGDLAFLLSSFRNAGGSAVCCCCCLFCRCCYSFNPRKICVISTGAAHASCEQRSGEICFFTVSQKILQIQPENHMSSPRTT